MIIPICRVCVVQKVPATCKTRARVFIKQQHRICSRIARLITIILGQDDKPQSSVRKYYSQILSRKYYSQIQQSVQITLTNNNNLKNHLKSVLKNTAGMSHVHCMARLAGLSWCPSEMCIHQVTTDRAP